MSKKYFCLKKNIFESEWFHLALIIFQCGNIGFYVYTRQDLVLKG